MPEDFSLQALAMRRQLAMLAHETLTSERSLVINAVLQLSYDLGRLEAPLPNQGRLAFICGIDKGDVSRAVSSLKDQGILRTRLGVDGWLLFEPRPDAGEWRGVRWRIADREQRARVLAELRWLSASDGPGDPQQASLPLRVDPTVEQEFDGAMAEVSRSHALREAGGMVASISSPAAVIPSGGTVLGVALAPGKREWAALKAHLKNGRGVGCLANEEPSTDPAALAGQPTTTLGKQGVLARQPTTCWPDSQQTGPESGTMLARQPTAASRVCPRVKPPSPISTSVHNPSPISPSPISRTAANAEEMGDGAGGAGRDGQTADGGTDLWAQIVAVIGPRQAKEWGRWWKRELAPPGRRMVAREALGELKIQLDLARAGARERIDCPGRWFVSKFCELAGNNGKAHQ